MKYGGMFLASKSLLTIREAFSLNFLLIMFPNTCRVMLYSLPSTPSNRMPSPVLQYKTLIQSLLVFFPTPHLVHDIPCKIFGGFVFVHVHKHNLGVLDPQQSSAFFLFILLIKRFISVTLPSPRNSIPRWMLHFFNVSHSIQLLRFKGSQNYVNHIWELDTPALPQVKLVAANQVPTSIPEPTTMPTITGSPSPPL